jgi:hypothetical protein
MDPLWFILQGALLALFVRLIWRGIPRSAQMGGLALLVLITCLYARTEMSLSLQDLIPIEQSLKEERHLEAPRVRETLRTVRWHVGHVIGNLRLAMIVASILGAIPPCFFLAPRQNRVVLRLSVLSWRAAIGPVLLLSLFGVVKFFILSEADRSLGDVEQFFTDTFYLVGTPPSHSSLPALLQEGGEQAREALAIMQFGVLLAAVLSFLWPRTLEWRLFAPVEEDAGSPPA